jgi:hypothetical protein
MPPDCEDNDQTQTPERTPAYKDGFGPNTDKLRHLLRLGQRALENDTAKVKTLTADMKTLSAGVVGLSGPVGEQVDKIRAVAEELGKQATDIVGGVLIVHEMMPVLFVTIVEAYLKDVLIYAAGIDASLMDRTGQTLTYPEALNAKSLEEVLIEFRSKRARSFVDNGGPTTWIESLEAMGARGYRRETVSQMETLWDVRHLIVHCAGVANADFVRRHPELNAQVGKRFIVNGARIKQWGDAMYDFVDITDQYFVRRCQKSQKLLPSADAPKAPETQGESLTNR